MVTVYNILLTLVNTLGIMKQKRNTNLQHFIYKNIYVVYKCHVVLGARRNVNHPFIPETGNTGLKYTGKSNKEQKQVEE